MFRRDELDAMIKRFPTDFVSPVFRAGKGHATEGVRGRKGRYVDEWRCVWFAAEEGVAGEVKEFPLADWSALKSYKIPWELIREADFTEVDRSCAKSDMFMKVGTNTRPFERMQFLRGTESLFMDLAYGVKEVYTLRDMLHEFFVEELRLWAKTDVDGIGFMDDWGTQHALLISPKTWREFYKPLYKDYCDIIRGAGKKVFFHTDGHVEAIYPDLIEIGVDAINSQLFCMDIEALAERHKGQITFWGEIDRQEVLPFGSADDVREAVRRVRRAMDDSSGGLIAQCEWGMNDPAENIAAVYETWDEPRPES
jgi:hypothetical protein